MTNMDTIVSLSDAKANFSEVVRAVRTLGAETIITVGGQPAARLVPMAPQPRPLTDAEVASFRALMTSLRRIERPPEAFDAVELVAEGRR